MSAPIAEVPPPAPRQPGKTPPLALTIAVWTGIALNLLFVVFHTPMLAEIGVSATWERVIMLGVGRSFWHCPVAIGVAGPELGALAFDDDHRLKLCLVIL